ncbi:sugar phosphate isomerase/epimerase family protein [Leifsonia sp. TF02-11]|uniref:sugar phosphate isomerase/epimerase family protein n=1 Tax=Leifsonia sp. TF02-11 TaxID=2815212 RepID=UPI001AA1BFE0|nr:sugar phosphate isomerase/epimerase [Leifsonia sp. TF02-11]MBO1740764.1 sugar phosphate isomerase/epimerase [Leifsonia sp. TF02-11]
MTVKIALDPTPYLHSHQLLEFPRVVADLGYQWWQLTPHPDFLPFFNHPRADDELVAALKKATADVGVGISSLLPVQRWSSPDEEAREGSVRNWRRIIELAVELDVRVINTEFSGRPERAEESERAFYRSMETLLPLIESEGLRVNIDPHPDDFVENGFEAIRIIRGLNSASVGFVYVGSHTFHYGDDIAGIIAAAGHRLGAAYVADSFDHNRSHGLRYITNPPGNAVRVHQHLALGDGDVDWDAYFAALAANGFYDRDDSIIVSNVFAEDERGDEVSRSQLEQIRTRIQNAGGAI